jgi:hypothetical protein
MEIEMMSKRIPNIIETTATYSALVIRGVYPIARAKVRSGSIRFMILIAPRPSTKKTKPAANNMDCSLLE